MDDKLRSSLEEERTSLQHKMESLENSDDRLFSACGDNLTMWKESRDRIRTIDEVFNREKS